LGTATKIKTKVEPKTNLQMTNEQYLKSALSFFGYKIDDKFAKIITEVFPLVQSKGGEVTIMDLCKVMAKIEPELEAKTEPQPTEILKEEENPQNVGEAEVEEPNYPNEIELEFFLNKAISEFVFTERARNVFRYLEIRCLRHLYEWSEDTLIRQRGIGKKTLSDIQITLGYHNLPKLKKKETNPPIEWHIS
jgi:DNA-directed RNA polymerase alpha subunit